MGDVRKALGRGNIWGKTSYIYICIYTQNGILHGHKKEQNNAICSNINPEYSLKGLMKLKLQYFDYMIQRADSLEKTLMLGKIEGRKRRDEMVGWHHRLDGHEFEEAPGDGDGQGSLVCYSPWGCKESDTTEWLNNNKQQHGWT